MNLLREKIIFGEVKPFAVTFNTLFFKLFSTLSMKMKTPQLGLLALLMCLISQALMAQTTDCVGTYTRHILTVELDILDYQITLKNDGTFTFTYYSKLKNRIPVEDQKEGHGTWVLEKNVITFTSATSTSDTSQNLMDFSETKARWIAPSPRNTSAAVKPQQLLFLSSKVHWLPRLVLEKT